MRTRSLLVCLALCVASLPEYGAVISYFGVLSGANESPAVPSPGTGFAFITIDTIANTMQVEAEFSGLLGNSTNAHIHCCTTPNAGVATTTPTFLGFPSGVTSGTYNNTLDLTLASSYNGAFITANGGSIPAAQAALLAGLADGVAYFNVHSTFSPSGEIRANLLATPEPGTFALMAVSLIGLMYVLRRTIRSGALR